MIEKGGTVRARSPETEIRRIKAEVRDLKSQVRVLQSESLRRNRIGTQMSNICFNLAQAQYVPAEVRACLDMVRKEWDASK